MPNAQVVDRVVNQLLDRFDANKDGKLSKQEARGPLAEMFDRFDANKDGFLDRAELRKAAQELIARRGGGPGAPAPNGRLDENDFDALDANADGRLTREELKGTKWASQFDLIDTNKDGKIDRKEFEAFLAKQALSP